MKGENGEFYFNSETDLNQVSDYAFDRFGRGMVDRVKLSFFITGFDSVCDLSEWLDYNNIKYTLKRV